MYKYKKQKELCDIAKHLGLYYIKQGDVKDYYFCVMMSKRDM